MDFDLYPNLERLIFEVFEQEERQSAELRLTPEEAAQLVRRYGACCTPMDGAFCPDGKRWYRVWLPDCDIHEREKESGQDADTDRQSGQAGSSTKLG
ncbi:hypothetical protein [Flavonifractor sp. An100]|uniref:hypothetical protein n=1 Tax=Flavonifractor sp. An100 TaxID=1965538 RepID=UPI001179B05A|nr:hypothetical protein [Flavonifractor sp. An100]